MCIMDASVFSQRLIFKCAISILWKDATLLSVKGNLDTASVMTVLSKGQGGAAEGCRDSKIREQCPSASESVGSRRHACSHHLRAAAAAAAVLHLPCLEQRGRGGEEIPGAVQHGGHPYPIRELAGIMGVQHQHQQHQPGKHGEPPGCLLQSTRPRNQKWCCLILMRLVCSSGCSRQTMERLLRQ